MLQALGDEGWTAAHQFGSLGGFEHLTGITGRDQPHRFARQIVAGIFTVRLDQRIG